MLAVPLAGIPDHELEASLQEEGHVLGPRVTARVRAAALANPANALATVMIDVLFVDVVDEVLMELVPEAAFFEDGILSERPLRHFTLRGRHWPHGPSLLEESARAFREQFGEDALAEFLTAVEDGPEDGGPAGGADALPDGGVGPGDYEEAPPAAVGPALAPKAAPTAALPRERAAALRRPPVRPTAAPLLASGGAAAGRVAFAPRVPAEPAPSAALGFGPPPGQLPPPHQHPGYGGTEARGDSRAAWQAVLGRHGAPPGPELRGRRATAPSGPFPGTGDDFGAEGEEGEVAGGSDMERFAAALMGAARAFSQRGDEGGTGGGDDLMGLGGGNIGAGVRGTAHREALIASRRSAAGSFSRSLMETMGAQSRSSRVPRGAVFDPPDPRLWLERTGGWSEFTPGSPNTVRDLALIAWQVADIVDRLWMNQYAEAADSAALLLVGLDQARIDGGRLDMMWLYQFERDPPASLFARGGQSAVGTRQFSPLANPRWSTVNLAYLRELDPLETRRSELQRPQGRTPVPRARATPEDGQPGGAGVIGPGGGGAEAAPKQRPRRRQKPAAGPQQA